MGLFQKKIGPVFLKEDSEAELFIERLKKLSEKADGELRQDIEKQIKLAAYGLAGEKNIAFELRNSGMDMLILHDLYFEHNGMQAQIDYIVISRRRIYIIECKNLIGNIEIDNSGNFIRTYELFGKPVKEGLYSPITQNERHKLVIREMRRQEEGILKKLFFGKSPDSTYQAVVVLANPKTYLNARYAKKEIKDQVIRADQLINYIRQHDEAAESSFGDEEMRRLAEFFLDKDIPDRSDYAKKYEEILEQYENSAVGRRSARPMWESYGAGSTSDGSTVEKAGTNGNSSMGKAGVNGNNGADGLICPRCGAQLVLRTASKGDNAGRKFLGCTAFPRCRYIGKIEED
ncbi:MAG: NERD domain-containing protein [Lachnospiraceae bacterium]|nr:NERD domain-containing protein [Lachnospiraceae bacterium]